MAGENAGDASFNIPDSSDWLNTPLAPFADIESALRCQVCKDFYKTPMITTCAHTFCSLCIRHSFSNDQKCPACRAAGQESQLRRNGAMEELVEAFQKARQGALDFARQASTTGRVSSPSPKRKIEEVVEDEMSGDRPSKRTRASSRRTAESAARVEETSRNTASPDLQPSQPETRHNKPGLVECPICTNFVEELDINAHIDNGCQAPKLRPKPPTRLTPGVLKSTRQSLQPKAALQPLAHLNYSGMKENILRKKLRDQGVPDWGSKIEMTNRYTEWISIWNANCDSTKNQRSLKELLSDLNIWEKTQGALAPKTSTAINTGLAIKDKNFDGTGWAVKHHDDFSDLIAKARQTRSATKTAAIPPSDTPQPAASSSNVATETFLPVTSNIAPELIRNAYGSPYTTDTPTVPPIRPEPSPNMPVTPAEPSSNTPPKETTNELPSILPTAPEDMISPFPSSQLSYMKTSDEIRSSQFTMTPGSKRFFEDENLVDNEVGVGVTSHP